MYKCNRCGKELSGIDGPRPAETYAGTYTGLCYECEGLPDFVLKEFTLDNCKLISTPPACPSWRRDRETYYAYSDCSECGGKGYKWVSRSLGSGGSYRGYCETCIDRFEAHPLRKKAGAIKSRRRTIITAAENRYTKALLEEVKKRKLSKKRKLGRRELLELLGEIAEPIKTQIKAEAEVVLDKLKKSKAFAWAESLEN